MLTTGSQTVLVFKEIQFLGDWTRANGANVIIYTPNKNAELIVLVENYAGNNVTYYFTVKANNDVWVSYGGDAQVHIPALCLKSQPGDQIRCG
jgi:uncharacterized protein (UPF0333 family)